MARADGTDWYGRVAINTITGMDYSANGRSDSGDGAPWVSIGQCEAGMTMPCIEQALATFHMSLLGLDLFIREIFWGSTMVPPRH